MTTLREAAQQAFEAIDHHGGHLPWNTFVQVRKDLRAALEQPEPEPVAWMRKDKGHVDFHKHLGYLPLYTAPPQRAPLTNEQIKRILTANGFKTYPELGDDLKPYCYAAIRAIERAHGIKETK